MFFRRFFGFSASGRFLLLVGTILISGCVTRDNSVTYDEPIYHEVSYPEGEGPFPVVVALHTSGGFKTVKRQIPKYTNAGYAVYAPDFFVRHGITYKTRVQTWTTYRTAIEADLIDLIEVVKKDPKADPKNIFAVGFSNGGYWASFLAARKYVNAGASHYGVWHWSPSNGWNGYPADYFDHDSNPVLGIHGDNDMVQQLLFVNKQLNIAGRKSPKFRKYIFKKVGHSWDCQGCRKYVHDEEATKKSLQITLDFFQENKR